MAVTEIVLPVEQDERPHTILDAAVDKAPAGAGTFSSPRRAIRFRHGGRGAR
jgi:hypothetical protein